MNHNYKEFLSLLGYLYLQNGKQDKALIIFSALCELLPEDDRLGLCLGYVQLLKGDCRSAVERADQFLAAGQGRKETAMGRIIRNRALSGLKNRAGSGRMTTTGKETE